MEKPVFTPSDDKNLSDPFRPLTKEEWEERLARAEADFKTGRVRNGFEVYARMKEKYGL